MARREGAPKHWRLRKRWKLTWIMSAKEGCVGGVADLEAFLVVELGFLEADIAVDVDGSMQRKNRGAGGTVGGGSRMMRARAISSRSKQAHVIIFARQVM